MCFRLCPWLAVLIEEELERHALTCFPYLDCNLDELLGLHEGIQGSTQREQREQQKVGGQWHGSTIMSITLFRCSGWSDFSISAYRRFRIRQESLAQ